MLSAMYGMVTGGNTGVGKETVKVCFFHHYPSSCGTSLRGAQLVCTGPSES